MASVQTNPIQATPAHAAQSNTIYLIRHGEKPKTDDDIRVELEQLQEGNKIAKEANLDPSMLTGNDLDIDGWGRALKLPEVLSSLKITHIIAQKADDDNDKSKRPEETVSFFKNQNPDAIYNNNWSTGDFSDVATDALKYVKEGNVVICWEHLRLMNIAQAIGVQNLLPYPDDRFDLIWTIPKDAHGTYTQITAITSEQIKNNDDLFIGNRWKQIDGGWEETDSDENPLQTFLYHDIDPDDKTKSTSAWVQSEMKHGELKPKEKWSRLRADFKSNTVWAKFSLDKDTKKWVPKEKN